MEGKGSLVVLLLAERARSEGARSTRAIEDRSGHPLEIQGGFKFQVQRVNDDAVAYRLPGAWRSSDIFWGAC
jgi:hypothetical protein